MLIDVLEEELQSVWFSSSTKGKEEYYFEKKDNHKNKIIFKKFYNEDKETCATYEVIGSWSLTSKNKKDLQSLANELFIRTNLDNANCSAIANVFATLLANNYNDLVNALIYVDKNKEKVDKIKKRVLDKYLEENGAYFNELLLKENKKNEEIDFVITYQTALEKGLLPYDVYNDKELKIIKDYDEKKWEIRECSLFYKSEKFQRITFGAYNGEFVIKQAMEQAKKRSQKNEKKL